LPRGRWASLTVRLDLYERLKAMAASRGATMDELLRQLVGGVEAERMDQLESFKQRSSA